MRKITPLRLDCRQAYRGFSLLVIDDGGPIHCRCYLTGAGGPEFYKTQHEQAVKSKMLNTIPPWPLTISSCFQASTSRFLP